MSITIYRVQRNIGTTGFIWKLFFFLFSWLLMTVTGLCSCSHIPETKSRSDLRGLLLSFEKYNRSQPKYVKRGIVFASPRIAATFYVLKMNSSVPVRAIWAKFYIICLSVPFLLYPEWSWRKEYKGFGGWQVI